MKLPAVRFAPRVIFRRLFKTLLVLGVIALLGAAIALGTTFFVYRQLAGTYDITKLSQMPSHSQVFDGDGKPYGRLQNDQNRVVVQLKDISPRFLDAIVAREDSRFWQHHGVDFYGIARAFLRNVRSGGTREGASTITQQLARNSLSLGGQTLHRKLIEAMVANRIEGKYTKEQILEFYLNRIYLGSGVYGVEAASQKYFGKPSKQMTLGESAMLAGIVRNPNRNSPLKNIKGALADRDSVLDRMAFLEKISAKEAADTKAEPVKVATSRVTPLQEDYVLDAVRNDLDDLVSADAINEGGLKIYTTIDLRLQNLASAAVEDQLANIERTKGYGHLTREEYRTESRADGDKPAKPDASPEYLQGALLAVDNRTGAIMALVGGRNFEESRYNRALLARRQIGSTFKPFVYAAAFERGLQPGSLVEDSPLRPGELGDGQRDWKPANSDSNFLGVQPADIGLIQSRNIMSIRVGQWAGMDNVIALAKRAGLQEVPRYPSMYLGSFETSLKTLTSAYTAFANHGVEHPAYLIERVDAANGQLLYQAERREIKVMSEGVAQTTSDVLERVLTEGTGRLAASFGFRIPGAGKTGTTNDYKDAWFLGYTSSLTCGVWVGMDKPQTITAKGYGSTLALPIWADFMQGAASSSKRFPALALHLGAANGATTIRTAAADPADRSSFGYANNNAAPPPTAGPVVATQPFAPDDSAAIVASVPPVVSYQNPIDPGSHLIKDPQTGRVVGIDGSVSAAQEQQAFQEQQRQLAIKRQEQLAALRQQGAPTPAPFDPYLPVRRAVPVQPADEVIGGRPGVAANAASAAAPLPTPGYPGVRRAIPVEGVGTPRVFDPATNRIVPAPAVVNTPPVNPYLQPAQPANPVRRRRIYTLPDGTQVTQEELDNGR